MKKETEFAEGKKKTGRVWSVSLAVVVAAGVAAGAYMQMKPLAKTQPRMVTNSAAVSAPSTPHTAKFVSNNAKAVGGRFGKSPLETGQIIDDTAGKNETTEADKKEITREAEQAAVRKAQAARHAEQLQSKPRP